MMTKPRIVVLLANLGTPTAATPHAVRQFLAEFLSDKRVIELPKLLWRIILYAFILPFRPKRVAHAYQSIWQADSPMRVILHRQAEAVSQQLKARYHDLTLTVMPVMSYGQPSIEAALAQVTAQKADAVLLLPLFPQYSATSTAPLYDKVAKWAQSQRYLPSLAVVRDYHQHPDYIEALAASVRRYQAQHGVAEKLLLSFHGIPQPYAERGDPYPDYCQQTANKLAAALGLTEQDWAISFQSRFGKQEWVKPYTDVLLKQWAEQGVTSVQVLSPAFSADCLETLEELALQNRDLFLAAGGKQYAYIEALNSQPEHIDFLSKMVGAQLDAWRVQFAQ